MRRIVLVVGILGGLGYLGYRFFAEPKTPQICEEMADRCQLGHDQLSACKRVFREVRGNVGDEAAGRLADCLHDAWSCRDGADCAHNLGLDVDGQSSSLRDFSDALRH